MTFEVPIEPGDVVDNQTLQRIFLCSPQGGMRRSHRTGTLVLVSKHKENIYGDHWQGEIFHYTGMGMRGDQNLYYRQNRTLAESQFNGVEVHLFQWHRTNEYTYRGKVALAGKPYQERQFDADSRLRRVWMFPLKVRAKGGG